MYYMGICPCRDSDAMNANPRVCVELTDAAAAETQTVTTSTIVGPSRLGARRVCANRRSRLLVTINANLRPMKLKSEFENENRTRASPGPGVHCQLHIL
jgi:hypothetical protein